MRRSLRADGRVLGACAGGAALSADDGTLAGTPTTPRPGAHGGEGAGAGWLAVSWRMTARCGVGLTDDRFEGNTGGEGGWRWRMAAVWRDTLRATRPLAVSRATQCWARWRWRMAAAWSVRPHAAALGPYAPLAVFEGHTGRVLGALALADGSLLSWADDGTLRRWDPDGVPLAVFEGHTDGVRGALALADGSLLSWSDDGTLRRWDPDGVPLAVFEGHTDGVRDALALADGSLLSWSDDGTLRRWDPDGTPLTVFEGHTGRVLGALALADGSLLSWSRDHTRGAGTPTAHPWPCLKKSYWGDKARIFAAWARTQGFDANLLFAEENEPRVCGGRAARRGNQVYVYDPASGETLARFVGDLHFAWPSCQGDVIAAGMSPAGAVPALGAVGRQRAFLRVACGVYGVAVGFRRYECISST